MSLSTVESDAPSPQTKGWWRPSPKVGGGTLVTLSIEESDAPSPPARDGGAPPQRWEVARLSLSEKSDAPSPPLGMVAPLPTVGDGLGCVTLDLSVTVSSPSCQVEREEAALEVSQSHGMPPDRTRACALPRFLLSLSTEESDAPPFRGRWHVCRSRPKRVTPLPTVGWMWHVCRSRPKRVSLTPLPTVGCGTLVALGRRDDSPYRGSGQARSLVLPCRPLRNDRGGGFLAPKTECAPTRTLALRHSRPDTE